MDNTTTERTTTVVTPAAAPAQDSGSGLIIGIIFAIAVILLLVYAFRMWGGVPQGGTQINVPDQVDVNLDNGGGEGQ